MLSSSVKNLRDQTQGNVGKNDEVDHHKSEREDCNHDTDHEYRLPAKDHEPDFEKRPILY